MKLVVLLLFAATYGFSQLTGLTTTDDGSVLLFHSRMRLRGSSDFNEDKIYRWDGSYFVVDRTPAMTASVIQQRQPSFGDPSISGDGKVMAYFSDPGCSLCQMYVALQLNVKGAADPKRVVPDFARQLELSNNGRYLRIDALVYDLTTGQPTQFPPMPRLTATRMRFPTTVLFCSMPMT